MGLTLVTPPVLFPITLEEAKQNLRVTHSDEDGLIQDLIADATVYVEKELDLSLMTQTLRLTLDGFHDQMRLPQGPVQSVSEVAYVDESGATQTLSTDAYYSDLVSRDQWVLRKADANWPTTLNAVNAVTITYVAGHEAFPYELRRVRRAMFLLITHWFENRSGVNVGNIVNEVPLGIESLLWAHRRVQV